MTDHRLLTLAEIARRLDLPESTARYYRNKFATFIPSVGEGRKRRYRPEALDVLRIIAESMDRNLTATEIEERLSRDFARNIETATGPQPTAATTPQQPSIYQLSALFMMQQEAFQQVASALERLADRNEEVAELRKEVADLRRELDDRDRRLVAKMREAMQSRQDGPRPRRWWWPFSKKKGGSPVKDGDIKNFDPSRLPGYATEQYTVFTVTVEDAAGDKEVAEVAMPAVGDPEEIKRQAMAFYRRAKFAEEYLDQKRVKEIAENTKPQTAEALAQWAALHVATNLCGVYAERTRKPFDDDEAFVRCMEQQKELVLDILAEIPDLYDTLHVTIWRHAIAWALEQMEDDHGSETLETLSADTFDDLLNEYIFDKQDFRDSAVHAMNLYAQDLARMILEAIDPARMPLDRLKALIGLGGPQTVDEKQELLDRMLAVPSGAPYFALQEIVATKGFHKEEETPWPVARINRRGARGTAQLRPAAMDEQPFMSPDEVEAWSKIMWRHREQMSALDVDVMDALAAIYLRETRGPNESAAADVDELLAMRGLKPKKGGSGTRGGYTPKQRREVMAALSRIQSIWLDMAEIDVIEETPEGGRRRSRKTVQSRPFVITDRMGQVRLDGYMDVEKFIFKPGAVFAHYLHGPGRQTALLNAKILELDPYREAWEKNIGRYLTSLWRIRARSGRYSDPLRVQTLLERTGYKLTPRRGMWIRERFEKALDVLTDHGIINGWQYDRWNEATTEQRGWFKEWLQATVLIEPPDEIEEHYQEIEQPAAPKTLPAHSGEELGPRLKAQRKRLRLTQMQAAEQLGITQAYFSQLERGRTKPGPALARKIQAWLEGN